MRPLIVVEMNEINFDFVQYYIGQGHLRNFSDFIDKHGVCKTTSRTSYEELEPWIQWVSARTGKTFAEHQVFRLGDIVESKLEQHWEILEKKGYSVAAISPINGANRTKSSPFWLPDPWVDTPTSGDQFMVELALAIRQAVNDNASEKLSWKTRRTLLRALLMKSRFSSWPCYAREVLGAARRRHWAKAVVLDRLLADVFINLWKRHRPDFSTLFLNSAAHIQHHYLYNSKAYQGGQKNPHWYIAPGEDPVLDIYKLYDSILGEVTKLDARIVVATGLKQVPYEEVTFYYRIINHEQFLRKIEAAFQRVQPRMSRDFLVECSDELVADSVSKALCGLRAQDGTSIFEVDNRGSSLFVVLSYPREIQPGFKVFNDRAECVIDDFSKEVAFVAIKNGHHDATGYFMDNAERNGGIPISIPLEDMFSKVMHHFAESRPG